MTITYTIEQHTGYQYEPIPEGDFETAEAAIAGMRELETEHGCRGMRVVKDAGPRYDLSGHPLIGDDAHEVIEYGLDDDEDEEMTITYTIQQHTGYQWEAILEGDFETAEAAIAGMRELETSHGWRDLRVVKDEGERYDLSGHLLAHEVIEYGLDADENEESAE